MAKQIRLRPLDEHPAHAGRSHVLQSVSPVHLAAILAVVAAGFLAVWQLAGLGGPHPAATQGGALGEPQSRAPLANVRGNRDRTHAWAVDTRTLDSRSRFTAPNNTTDFRLLPVALLTLAGVNITPLLKKRPGGSTVGSAPRSITFAGVEHGFTVATPPTQQTAAARKVLDLSRPTRAGPLRGPAIDTRASASSPADLGHYVGGV
jgi:hypothetical protein